MTERFLISKSNVINNGYVIIDDLKQFTFPISKGDERKVISHLIPYVNALNRLHEGNKELVKRIGFKENKELEKIIGLKNYLQSINEEE